MSRSRFHRQSYPSHGGTRPIGVRNLGAHPARRSGSRPQQCGGGTTLSFRKGSVTARMFVHQCWGAWTRTKNKGTRNLRVANYTTPHQRPCRAAPAYQTRWTPRNWSAITARLAVLRSGRGSILCREFPSIQTGAGSHGLRIWPCEQTRRRCEV